MIESDADRLATIQGLGGQLVRTDRGNFCAILDSDFSSAGFSDGARVNSESPQLTCRTSDVKRLQLDEGAELDTLVDGVASRYSVREHQPDGTGMSVLVLDQIE